MTDLRAEHELLLCVARRSLDEPLIARLRALAQQDVSWDYLITLAFDQGLLPLLCTHVGRHCHDIAPSHILDRLKSELFSNRQSNLYLLRELRRVLKLFRTQGIEVLSFKGPMLAELVYGDVGLRQAGDLDLLIVKHDFSRADELLRSAGYLMEPQLTPAQQRSHLRFHCEIQFAHQDQFSVVDLHWGITPKTFPLPMTFADLFARRETISLGGHAIETFAHEDLLLYLCVHGAKHYWRRLEWVAAITELVRAGTKLNWSLIVRRAKEAKSEKFLSLALLLVENLFSVGLPPEVTALLKGETLGSSAHVLSERLRRGEAAPPSQIEMFRWNLQFMEHRRDAIASLLRSVLVPTISDWQAISLPGFLHPLYYGFRPIRLLSKYRRPPEDE
ncbi:MAG: nucleotidyltransferase family protein [Pyrinomonadaceae bacterium]